MSIAIIRAAADRCPLGRGGASLDRPCSGKPCSGKSRSRRLASRPLTAAAAGRRAPSSSRPCSSPTSSCSISSTIHRHANARLRLQNVHGTRFM